MDKTKLLTKLRKIAEEHGITVIERTGGHIQLKGPHLLVNYYPFSAKSTAYVAGTTGGVSHCDLATAVIMACTAPPIAAPEKKGSRHGHPRQKRMALLRGRKEVKCYWCTTMIDIDTSTLEHIIPLDRGGLDQRNNWTLACAPCNWKRANNMPELDKSPPWETT